MFGVVQCFVRYSQLTKNAFNNYNNGSQRDV